MKTKKRAKKAIKYIMISFMIFAILLPNIINFIPKNENVQVDKKLMEEYVNSQTKPLEEDEETIKIPDIEGTYQVTNIPNGNTITVMWGNEKKNINLIGIKETSETKHVLETKLETELVQLEFDECYPNEDENGELFAYAYHSDGTFLNYDLILHGVAKLETNVSKNIKHFIDLTDAQNIAKSNQAGCWAEK